MNKNFTFPEDSFQLKNPGGGYSYCTGLKIASSSPKIGGMANSTHVFVNYVVHRTGVGVSSLYLNKLSIVVSLVKIKRKFIGWKNYSVKTVLFF